MEKPHIIIVPVDFSNSTKSLVEYAVYMAGKLSAVPHFIHVVDLMNFVDYYTGDAMVGVPYVQECQEILLTNAKEKMSNLVKDIGKKCTGCTGEVVTGDPVSEIIEIASDKGADLIIISTHGAKGLEKIMLGSVAGRVLKRAHCPVLTMNPFKNR